MPPGAKKSCSDGRRSPGSSGGGCIVMGVVADTGAKKRQRLSSFYNRQIVGCHVLSGDFGMASPANG